MYTPCAFKNDDLDNLNAAMRMARLAILVSHDESGLQATHLPLLARQDAGGKTTLQGHLAKANPHWQALASGAQALVIFPGEDAYVSPSFYPSKADHGKVVPTWNYTAIHAYGSAEVFHDATRLLAIVQALTEKNEASRPSPWTVSDAPAGYIHSMLKAIVGFELRIERLEGKRKLSQNRSAEDIEGVRNGLAASRSERDQALAALIR